MTNTGKKDENYYVGGFVALGEPEGGDNLERRGTFSARRWTKKYVQVIADEAVRTIGVAGVPEVGF